jgi:hypothetical protein
VAHCSSQLRHTAMLFSSCTPPSANAAASPLKEAGRAAVAAARVQRRVRSARRTGARHPHSAAAPAWQRRGAAGGAPARARRAEGTGANERSTSAQIHR